MSVRIKPPAAVALAALVSLSCAASQANLRAAHDPCRGSNLDLDEAATHCALPTNPDSGLVSKALRTVVLPSTVRVASGGSVTMTIESRNTSTKPMDLIVKLDSESFETTVENDQGLRVDEDSAGAGGIGVGMDDGSLKTVHVVLEPGGVLRKHLRFTARTRPNPMNPDSSQDRQPIPAGKYELSVTLPFLEPVPGAPENRETQVVSTQLTITPPPSR